MKKTLLCLALLAVLNACDNKKESQETAAQPEQSQAQLVHNENTAEQVEQRFRDLYSRKNQLLNVIAAHSAGADAFQLSVQDYQRGAESSTATLQLTLNLEQYLKNVDKTLSSEPVTLKFTSKIDHSAALAKEGIVAKAVSNVVVDDALKARFELDEEQQKVLTQTLSYLQLNVDFLADDRVKEEILVLPIHRSEEGKSFDYEGFSLTSAFKQSDIKDSPFYPATIALKSGDIKSVNGEDAFIIDTFEGNGETKANGDWFIKTTPINFHNDKQKQQIRIEEIVFQGEKQRYENDTGIMLGNQRYLANNISVKDAEGLDFLLKSFEIKSGVQKTNDLYDMSFASTAQFGDYTLPMNVIPFKFKQIKLDTALNRTNPKLAQQAMQEMQAGNTNQEKVVSDLVANAAQNRSTLDLAFDVDTQEGKANAKMNARFADDVKDVTLEKIEQYLIADAKVVIDESLVKATGMEQLFEAQLGSFIKKENGKYLFDFSLKDGKATINGQPAPIPMK